MIGVVRARQRRDGHGHFLVALVAVAIASAACSSPSTISSASAPGSTGISSGQGSAVNPCSSPSTTPSTSSPGSTSGQASAVNPCDLVTSDEANTLLAGATQRTGPTQQNRLAACKWETGQGANLLVTVGQGAQLYDPDLSNPGWRPVSGLGDQAFADGVTQTVGFIKGSTVVVLYVPAVQPVEIAALETLARTVAGRLSPN